MNGFHALTLLVSIPKSRSPFDKLRANGILEYSTAVFRFIVIHISSDPSYPPGSGYPAPWPVLSEVVRDGDLNYIHVAWIRYAVYGSGTNLSGTDLHYPEERQAG